MHGGWSAVRVGLKYSGPTRIHVGMDRIYAMSWTFSHTGTGIVFNTVLVDPPHAIRLSRSSKTKGELACRSEMTLGAVQPRAQQLQTK